MGNSERRTVYKNFELLNLHTNAHDFLHANYERYLKNARFTSLGKFYAVVRHRRRCIMYH